MGNFKSCMLTSLAIQRLQNKVYSDRINQAPPPCSSPRSPGPQSQPLPGSASNAKSGPGLASSDPSNNQETKPQPMQLGLFKGTDWKRCVIQLSILVILDTFAYSSPWIALLSFPIIIFWRCQSYDATKVAGNRNENVKNGNLQNVTML